MNPAFPTAKVREPIPVGPFLEFCAQREALLQRDPDCSDPRTRLILSFGWEPDSGVRRLHRWRHPEQGYDHPGWVDRAEVEDALHNFGIDIHEVYPDVSAPPPYSSRFGMGRYMTDRQLVAAHTVYVRAKLTVADVGRLVHARFGYRNANTAASSLRYGWRNLGLELRRCSAITSHDEQCHLHPLYGVDHCVSHRPPRSMPPELVAEARALHLDGVSFNEIGRRLLHRTPWRNPHYLSMHLARLAAAEGWHRTKHLGCRAREFQTATQEQVA